MFQSARLKLTAWYLVIIMSISMVFSLAIYRGVSHQIENLIRKQNERIRNFQLHPNNSFPPPPDSPPMISTSDLEKQKMQLTYTLCFINLSILVFSSAAGYFLAGRTLQPIKLMIDEQNEFVSNASHELRTPLATLRAEMEGSLLEKHITDQQARKLIQSNLEELGNLQELSNNLLLLTQVHGVDKTKFNNELAIVEIIRDSCKKVAAPARKKNILIKTDISEHIVMGNKNSLVELFVIILDNAIKYSPADTEINIKTELANNNLSIVVSDQGMGIDEKDMKHIFERFYRADRSRSQIEGFGLGLSIAKSIAAAHHGSITVKNNKTKGSSFIVYLPLKHS